MLRIVSAFYNAEKYIGNMINSLLSQTFTDWKCYITDDMSTDRSLKIIQELTLNDPRFVIIVNKEKLFPAGNQYQVSKLPEIDDNDIMVEIDGDDWLPNNTILEKLNRLYTTTNAWATYGRMIWYYGANQYRVNPINPPVVIEDIRSGKQPWYFHHLRSWKSFLFRNINPSDLIDPDTGNYWSSAGDVAFLLPIMEMAGIERIRYITEPCYIYNVETPINDHKVDAQLQKQLEIKIRTTVKPYLPLKR